MTTLPKLDVIVCGSLHLDIVVSAPALPRIDETTVGRSWKKICGGKGGNQAVQAAKAGALTALFGSVGNDEFGQTLRANLAAFRVDHHHLAVDEKTGSGMSVAILQDDGDYGAVIISGANLTIDPAKIANQWADVGGARVLVLQNEIPETVNIAAAEAARAAGAYVMLNAAPARSMSSELLRRVDLLVVNRIEAEALFGVVVNDRKAARAVLSNNQSKVKSVVITLGGDGLVVMTENGGIVEIPALPVSVVSTHGAGDCFVGVLAAQLARGAKLVEACNFANTSAAAFVAGN